MCSYCAQKSRETLSLLLSEGYVLQVINTTHLIVQRIADMKVSNWLRENITVSK